MSHTHTINAHDHNMKHVHRVRITSGTYGNPYLTIAPLVQERYSPLVDVFGRGLPKEGNFENRVAVSSGFPGDRPRHLFTAEDMFENHDIAEDGPRAERTGKESLTTNGPNNGRTSTETPTTSAPTNGMSGNTSIAATSPVNIMPPYMTVYM